MKAKSILVPVIVLGAALTGAILWNNTGVDAANTERRSEMAKDLAAKLNVDESKVTEAMDQIHVERRAERQAERKAEISTKLDQAVTDGAITAEQKQKILDKMAENQAANTEGQNRGKNREAMEQWFTDNGIDFDKVHDYIGFGPGNGEGRGMGGGRGMHRGE